MKIDFDDGFFMQLICPNRLPDLILQGVENDAKKQASCATPNGRCVICSAPGTSDHDFICSDCGDPLGVTMFCRNCGRRLSLDPNSAKAFLEDHGYSIEDVTGLVMKVDKCSVCMQECETVDLSIFRIRIG